MLTGRRYESSRIAGGAPFAAGDQIIACVNDRAGSILNRAQAVTTYCAQGATVGARQSSRRACFRLLTSIRSWSRLAARFIANRFSYPQNLQALAVGVKAAPGSPRHQVSAPIASSVATLLSSAACSLAGRELLVIGAQLRDRHVPGAGGRLVQLARCLGTSQAA